MYIRTARCKLTNLDTSEILAAAAVAARSTDVRKHGRRLTAHTPHFLRVQQTFLRRPSESQLGPTYYISYLY